MSTPSIKELRQASARRGQRSPKWLRLLVIAAGLFAFYVIAGFFIAPPIVRAQLAKRLSAELGREVSVAKVALNPLTLSAAVEGFAIREAYGKEAFIAWKRAFANVDSWSLFVGEWRFDEVVLDGASANIAVDRDGKLNFADILNRLAASPAPAKPASEPKPLRIGRLTVSGAKLAYREDLASAPFATVVGPVSFSLRDFHTGGASDAPGEFSATTESGETIGWSGTLAVAPLRSSGEFSLGNIVLKKYMPYVAHFANFAIKDGTLAVKSHYELVFAGDTPTLKTRDGTVSLQRFQLGAPGASVPALELDTLEMSGLAADSAARTATVGRVAVTGGRVAVTRDAQGIDLLRLLEPKLTASAGPGGGASAAPAVALPSGAAAKPFDAHLGELAITGLSVALTDTTTPRPARQEIEQLSLNVKNVSLARLDAASPLDLSVTLTGGGALRVSGSLAPQPLTGDLAVELESVPFASLSPYVESVVNARIASGAVSTKARVRVATPAAGAAPVITAEADATVSDFSALAGAGTDELARWKTLSIRGIEAVTAPSVKLLIADIEWTEPTGHVIIGEDGGLNLAGLMKTAADSDSVPSVSFKSKGAAPAQSANAPFVAIDRFQLVNAAFTYLDRSMEPDVKLALRQLSGTVAGLSSATLARADVDLKGKVDGVAPVSIRGQINPLASEAFTDLKVEFNGIDLLPTGPYVGRYAGYQLDRGALSLDVKVKLSQRRLDTNNVVTLDQFTLGQKTDSPDATKLPVGLALALLRDRQGKIVIDVPVQGSLDDPEFRVGRVMVRVLVNLLTKAATSPFALLGSMFGGGQKGEELAFQEFAPGTTELTEASMRKLEVIAKALRERPSLRLDIAGAYGATADAPALRERELEKGLRVALWEEQRRSAPAGTTVPPPEQITVTPEASARMIGVFYRAAFEPKEPAVVEESAPAVAPTAVETKTRSRELAPVTRQFRRGGAPVRAGTQAPREMTPPPPRPFSTATTGASGPATSPDAKPAGPTHEEMRAKLLAAIPVDENLLRQLAAERAQRVRSYLVEGAQIEAERLSLVAETAKGARVDLQLK